jgi:RNA polymerase sigma-70 factor, ECF subfamily
MRVNVLNILGCPRRGELMEEFEAWYRAQHPRVLASIAALAGDLDAAREATDEAFARALEHWATLTDMTAPGGWVQTVALNVLRRTLRRRRFVPHRSASSAVSSDHEVPLPDPDLWAAVRTLPHRQQVAVVLRYVHDLPEEPAASSRSWWPQR